MKTKTNKSKVGRNDMNQQRQIEETIVRLGLRPKRASINIKTVSSDDANTNRNDSDR